jgi:hypothetical protein
MSRTATSLFCTLLFSLSAACTSPNPDLLPDEVDLSGSPSQEDMSSDPGADLSGSGSDMSTSITAECRNLATALCSRLGKCSQYLLRYYYGDEKTCTERVQLTCEPYTRTPGNSWSIERLRACTAGYSGGTCEDYFAPGGPKGCQPQAGTLADGAACATGDQCKSAFCNAGTGGCGTCVTPARSGESCSAMKPCALGLSCASGRCAAPGGAGTPCGATSAPCKTGFYCAASGSCAAVLGEGKTCDPFAPSSGCDGIQGLFCGTTSRKCEAYKLANPGEACGTVMSATVLCAAAGTCGGTGANRKCAAAARDGEACGPTGGGASCMSPAACSSSKCAVFNPGTCK